MIAEVVPHYFDLLGLPFERGARGPGTFDCYGLAKEMFRRNGVELPDFVSPGSLEEVESLIDREKGRWRRVPLGTVNSLVTLRVEGLGAHVGYTIARDRYLHTTGATGVTTDRLSDPLIKPLGAYVYG
ncbi:NlpC/P60 family protein [Sphingomonas sp. NFR04]|uniref:NlpC/P60 family protein n=1 Tax=Sphingomonas sp. NFR04 TaxID=1566283 RepID=UPI0008ED2198|nr:NlpC/P60 family protein [Sphingomonas sp. NFR04]SFJ50462.1 NlpC/P60 family protein [Sphingomonas sp. NFR04]